MRLIEIVDLRRKYRGTVFAVENLAVSSFAGLGNIPKIEGSFSPARRCTDCFTVYRTAAIAIIYGAAILPLEAFATFRQYALQNRFQPIMA